MEIVLSHGATYTTNTVVPVSVVANTLLANEALIREAIKVLENLVDGLELEVKSVAVSNVSNNSPLREYYAIAIVMAFHEDLEKAVPAIVEKLTGQHIPDGYDTIVTVLFLIAAFFIIEKSTERLIQGKSFKHLTKELERLKSVLAGLVGKPKEEVDATLLEIIGETPSKTMVGNVMKFFRPAMLERGTEIHCPGGNRVSVDIIKELPTDVEIEMETTTHVDTLNNVVMDVHSSDRDYQKRGWHGVIESVTPRRLRLELSPSIDQVKLYGATKIRGNFLLIKQREANGEMVPKSYFLNELVDGKQSKAESKRVAKGRKAK